MAIKLPRVRITVDDDRGMGTQGELSGLSLGFGIHQAWIYTAMYGANTLFATSPSQAISEIAPAFPISPFFLISIVVFALTLLFAAATDQKFLRFYTTKRVIIAAVGLMMAGTLAAFGASAPGALGLAATIFAGVTSGLGSAVVLLFWGVAFSRYGAATIVINTAVAIVIAVAIYSFALHVIPVPYSGVLAALLPVLELPLLWRLTPVSYSVRHAVPIFNPLSVKKGSFAVRLALPVLLFGFALGALRTVSTQIILPSSSITTQLLALFAGGAATVLLMITAFSIDKRSHWDFLFRPLVPFIVITLFFLPTLTVNDSLMAPLVLLTGYMCFEALMWVFFGEMAQEFRISPIFLFGIGRGCLALGSLVGSLAMTEPEYLNSLMPFGEAGGVVLIMLALVMAYALLPRVRDIKRAIVPRESDEGLAVASFNKQAELVAWEARVSASGATPPEATTGTAVGWVTGTASWPGGVYGSFVPTAAPSTTPSAGNPGAGAVQSGGAYASASAGANAAMGAQNAGLTASGNRGAESAPDDPARKSGRFRVQCETIADRYLLSRRETEVMFLLARGHNAAYIQDKLCISKSTAKTHISHIYRKLDIHTQQELLKMVDEARDE